MGRHRHSGVSNPSVVIYQLAAAVSNGIALSQAVAGAGNLTLAGSLVTSGVATLDSGGAARRVVMASSGNDATVVFTITGTSRSGVVQTDTITGLNGATTGFSTLDFATVTRISSSAATVGNITAGTNSIGSSPWVVDNFLCAFWLLSGGISGPAS